MAKHIADSAPVSTPRQSRLPGLGSARQNHLPNATTGPTYQASPVLQQRMQNNIMPRGLGHSVLGVPKDSMRTGMPLQR